MVYKSSLLCALMVSLVALACVVDAQLSSFDSAQNSVQTAYGAILDANNAGVDTNPLVDQLNQALNLTSQAWEISNSAPQKAEELSSQAQVLAQNVTQQAIAEKQSASAGLPILWIISIVGVLAFGAIIYFFGPKALMKVWFKLRKNNRVTLGNSQANGKTAVVSPRQVCTVVLAVALIIAGVASSQILLPNGGEQFSELGIMGSNMKLGDYPSNVVASETVHLYVYVGNQMGMPMFYTVMVKLGDNTTQTNPANLTSIRQDRQVVANNQTWTYPVDITLTEPGDNQRLIFELWCFNQTTGQNQYHERWGQIWLNVTAPAT